MTEVVQIQGDDRRNAIFLALYKRENCLATGTKVSNGNGVTETFRLVKELQLNPVEVKYKLLVDQEEDVQPAWFLQQTVTI